MANARQTSPLTAPRRLPVASSVALVAANLLPVWGVLFGGWSVFAVMVLFWFENIVIGFFNVLKMLAARADGPGQTATKTFLVPFFIVHYGLFCLVHGVFVVVLFGGAAEGFHRGYPDARIAGGAALSQLLLPALALFVSHGVSFVLNYLWQGESRRVALPKLMSQPYGRVVLLHVTILAGAFLVLITGSSRPALLLLVALKTVADLAAHLLQNGGYSLRDLAAHIAATGQLRGSAHNE